MIDKLYTSKMKLEVCGKTDTADTIGSGLTELNEQRLVYKMKGDVQHTIHYI